MANIASALSKSRVYWDPSKLNAALLAAYRPSVNQAVATSKAKAKLPKAGVKLLRSPATSLDTARDAMVPTGLGWVQEGGRQGGYPIFPNQGLGLRRSKVGGAYTYRMRSKGGFSSSAGAIAFNSAGGTSNTGVRWFTFGGPMKAYPYIRPGVELWASAYYKDWCRRVLAQRGFGPGNVR